MSSVSEVRPHTWRPRGRVGRRHVQAASSPRSDRRQGTISGNTDDRLLAALRRHRLWTTIGLLVAVVAAASRFVAIGVVPPSIKPKPFAHATASTQLVVAQGQVFTLHSDDQYEQNYSPRGLALADMVASPEVVQYVARAAGIPASKIGVLGPQWAELQRTQQWATGPKRASQIIVEDDPYHITVDAAGTVISVQTQAPTTKAAARLASATAVGLNAFLAHLQSTTGVPEAGRYAVTQLGPVSTAPARTSQLANVGIFTFVAVFVLWCGGMLAFSGLMRDLRESAARSKVGRGLDRSSDSRPFPVGTD